MNAVNIATQITKFYLMLHSINKLASILCKIGSGVKVCFENVLKMLDFPSL